MKNSANLRLAVNSVITLRQVGQSMSVSQLALRMQVSEKHLEKTMQKMRAAGLVRSTRGVKGGYALCKQPQEISLAELMHAVDEEIQWLSCKGEQNCRQGVKCSSHDFWHHLSGQLTRILQHTTLDRAIHPVISTHV